MTTLNQNQFAMIAVQGDLDLQYNGGVISAIVSSAQATPLVAGQAVKIDTTVSHGMIPILGLAANTDSTFAFVIRTLKDQNFPANQAVEIALQGSVMQMTSGATITRGDKLEVVQSNNTVITNAGTNPVIGFALNTITTPGDLVRVYILTPGVSLAQNIASVSGLQTALNTKNQTAIISVTQAQLNAGQVLIPGVAGQSITVIDMQANFTGTFAAGTAMVVESTNASPVVVDTLVLAGMTGYQRLPLPTAVDAHQTPGAGAGVPLGVGDGLQVVHTGSAFTGGTAINFLISYVQK